MIDKVISHIKERDEEYLNRLNDWLRIPCISTDPEAKDAMTQAANWAVKLFTDCGIDAELVQTPGHPAVIADTGPAQNDGPTVLIYGHYDVQPTGDLSLWNSGPFEPQVRDGRIYARGSADDKGQVLVHMLAAEAWKKVAGQLPIRIKFLIEGEEEIGSGNLGQLVKDHAERLACDYVCISDTAKFNDKTPAITYGTRGMVYKEIIFTGPNQDLHSGSFGGTVANPANALAILLSKLKGPDCRVTIPGYYDDVLEATKAELEAISNLPFDEEKYLESLGSPALEGEVGYSTALRRWLRPTLDVNGILSGFTGEGASTIIPARAMAKVSMRIVPNQKQEKISAAFDEFVKANAPDSIRCEVKTINMAGPYVCPIENPGIAKAAAAVRAAFDTEPAFIREGGTLPILPLFKEILDAESIMMGLCLPNCNAHGPNEFMVLDDFYKGIQMAAHLPNTMQG